MCARKTFDMALHRSTLCSPTIRHMPTIQNHGEFLISAFIFHSQFSIFNFYPAIENHPRFSRVVFYLSHCSVSSHELGQLLNPLQRERRERHRLHGDRHDAAAVSGTVARLMGIPPEKSIFSSFGEVVYGFSRPPGQLTESNSPYFFKKQSSFNYLSLSASFTLSQKLLRLT